MGTMRSDTAYLGLAHTMRVFHHRQEATIDSRWLEWLPYSTQYARRYQDPAAVLYKLKITHRSRLVDLLNAKISWRVIRRHRLDNPTNPIDYFQRTIREAAERKRTRPNTHRKKSRVR